MKTKTNVKAGKKPGLDTNHNQGLRVKTSVKAGKKAVR